MDAGAGLSQPGSPQQGLVVKPDSPQMTVAIRSVTTWTPLGGTALIGTGLPIVGCMHEFHHGGSEASVHKGFCVWGLLGRLDLVWVGRCWAVGGLRDRAQCQACATQPLAVVVASGGRGSGGRASFGSSGRTTALAVLVCVLAIAPTVAWWWALHVSCLTLRSSQSSWMVVEGSWIEGHRTLP